MTGPDSNASTLTSRHNLARKEALYRFYSDAGHLLYVGITSNPGMRMGQHAATKPWWDEVRSVTIEWYESRGEVAAAETRAIAIEHPLYNIQRPSLPRMAAHSISRTCGHCCGCLDGRECDMYRVVDWDEDDYPECPICKRVDCLYAFGYDTGNQHGFSACYDSYFPRRPRDVA